MDRNEFYDRLLTIHLLINDLMCHCKINNCKDDNFDSLYEDYIIFADLFNHWLKSHKLKSLLDDLYHKYEDRDSQNYY